MHVKVVKGEQRDKTIPKRMLSDSRRELELEIELRDFVAFAGVGST